MNRINSIAANPAPTAAAPATPPLPWWRFGMVWLVFGGPAVVVVAACVTGAIAWHGADEVLDTAAGNSHAAEAQAPALQARNHAATPQR